MTLRIDAAWVMLVLLVAVRIAPLFILAPVFGGLPAPALFRAVLIFAFAGALVGASGTALAPVPRSLAALLGAAAGEALVGAALAFGLAAAFAAFLVAGRLLDLQIGFGVANLIDPVSRTQAPLLGTALNLLALAVFFAADGHHALLRALAQSLSTIPPGRFTGELRTEALVAQFGAMFTFGLALAAPAMAAVLLLDLGFALASRSMPQMNVFIVAIPFKIVVGLGVLALSLRYAGGVMTRTFESIFRTWSALLS